MDFIFSEIETYYITIEKSEADKIKSLKKYFLNHKGLPNIIDPNKKYSSFYISENFQKEKNVNKDIDVILEEVKNFYKKKHDDNNNNNDGDNDNNNRNTYTNNVNKNIDNLHFSPDSLIILLKDNNLSDKKINICIKNSYKEILYKIDKNINVSSFEQVGSVLHLNLKEEQLSYGNIIGEILLNEIKNITTVITKIGIIENVHRCYNYKILAGENNLKTIHKEMNNKFFINLEHVYWCSKLQNERMDLIENFKKNDIVLDITCGVGPISIPAMKKGCIVYCNDINPFAIECLKENIKINKISNRSFVYNLDAKIFLEEFNTKIKVNHFVFNLPEVSLKFIKFLEHLNDEGIIHAYFFCRKEISVRDFLKTEIQADIEDEYIKEIRTVSPKKKMYKLSIKLKDYLKRRNKDNI